MKSMDPRSNQWYVIYTRPKFEKKIARRLDDYSIEHFMPLKSEEHQWHDRRKTVVVPVLPNYIFVRCQPADMLKIYSIAGFVRFISTGGEPDVVADPAMEIIKKVLLTEHEITADVIAPGETVRIVAGPFEGAEGVITSCKGNYRVVVKIDVINQYAMISVNANDLVKVSQREKSGFNQPYTETQFAHAMA